MINAKNTNIKSPAIKRKDNREWQSGVVSAWDSPRTPLTGLVSSGNVLLSQDGTVGPRPSLNPYGPQPTGTVLGEIFEFKNNTTKEYWLICLQNVTGTTSAYIARGEDTAWTICTGKTYDNTAKAHFAQVKDAVLIMNGEDNLSYLDISTSAVVPFTTLTAPTAPTVANSGSSDLTTGTTPFSITYRITANSTVGETEASSSTALAVNTDRDLWNPTTNSLLVTWSAVVGAVSYNVYMGVVGLFEYKIAAGINGLSFTDNGTYQQDIQTLYPTTNSTAGPKAKRGTIINGRPFLVGDKDQPFYVRYGGDFGSELDFSPAHGGGFTPVGNGTKEIPLAIKAYRDGRGNPQITVLCQGSNGKGKRYLLSSSTLDFAGTTISFYEVIEDNGEEGTDSADAAVIYNDDLIYPSRDGFKTTGTKPQLQNILSTNRISNTIQRDIKNLNSAAMEDAVGVAFEGKVYFGLPVASSYNNEVWVIDFDDKGAWMKPLSIRADWMMLYNDNTGSTHFLVLSDGVILEMTTSVSTQDNGVAFPTYGKSGLVYFSEDARIWAKLIQVPFVFIKPRGYISCTVTGLSEDGPVEYTNDYTFPTDTNYTGWGEAAWGARGWGEVIDTPVFTAEDTGEIIVEVDEELQYYDYAWQTVDAGVDYQLSSVVSEYVETGLHDLT